MKLTRLFYPILLALMLLFPTLSGATMLTWDEPAFTVANLDTDKPVMPLVGPEASGGDASQELFSAEPLGMGVQNHRPHINVISSSEWNHPPVLAKVTKIWQTRHFWSDH